jgi:hypothetical protein
MHYFSNRVVQVKRAIKSIQNLGYFTIGENLSRNSIYFAFNGQILSINGVTKVTARKLIRAQKNNVLIDFIEVKGIDYKLETI